MGGLALSYQPCKVYHCNSSHVRWERSRMGAWSAYHVIVIHRIHLPRIKLYCTATPRTRVRSRLVHPLIDRRPAADENCTYCTKLHSTVNTPIAILTYCTYSQLPYSTYNPNRTFFERMQLSHLTISS